jgi:hypothetical protein
MRFTDAGRVLEAEADESIEADMRQPNQSERNETARDCRPE